MVVSILIPIHNRIEITKAGLATLYETLDFYEQNKGIVDYKVVVIDDGSTDGSSEWIAEHYPQVVLLKGNGSLWWTGAVNMGAKHSVENLKADYVLLWNDDVFSEKEYFVKLAKLLEKDSNPNILYGSYIYEYPNKEKIWSRGGHFNKYLGVRRMYRDRKKDRNIKKIYWFTGMGTVIPANILKSLNYFDFENFPHYHGDTDFSLRAYEAGYTLICSSELKMWNKVEFSSYVAKTSWADYFKSLKLTQARYNIKREVMFLRRHTVTPFWVAYFATKQFKYLLEFLKAKYQH